MNVRIFLLALAIVVVAVFAISQTDPTAVTAIAVIAWLATAVLAGWLILAYKNVSLASVAEQFTTRDLMVLAILIAISGVFKGFLGQAVPMIVAIGGPGLAALTVGPAFFMWGVIANHLVRKPLVGTITMVLGGFIEIMVGNPAGLRVLLLNSWEGFGPDIPFIATRHQRLTLPVGLVGGFLAGVFTVIWGWWSLGFSTMPAVAFIAFIVPTLVGGLLGGLLGHYVARALELIGIKQPAPTIIE